MKIVGDKLTKEKVPYRRFKVPNYEKEIKQALDELDGPAFIHAVRLPTNRDIMDEMAQKQPDNDSASLSIPA